MLTARVTGVPELQRVFREFKRSAANRIAGPAVRKSASFAAKQVKAEIPSRYKAIRKAIGWRSIKTRFNAGAVGAKVGAAVGKAVPQPKARTGRKGVGIGKRNIHWWFLGTAERRQKAGRRTGRMPPQARPVLAIVFGHTSQINNIMRVEIAKGLRKEAARVRSWAASGRRR